MRNYLRPINAMMIAQFFASFGDNMILYIILAIMARDSYPIYYAPLSQAACLLPYIVFTPWLGRLADRFAKTNVMISGSSIKVAGIILLFVGCNPAFSYFVVGIGAAMYTMAKYGILPWLCHTEKTLIKYNSWVEGSMIAAVLVGGITGGVLSDYSINIAIAAGLIVFLLSIYFNYVIPANPANKTIKFNNSLRCFAEDFKLIFKTTETRFAITGTATFWSISTVFRLILIAWVPLVLRLTDNTDISILFALTGVGLVIGSFLAPYLISMKKIYRAVYSGAAMAILSVAFMIVHSVGFTVLLLLAIGACGAIFIIPLNATLQTIGKATIGPGRAVACQNIVENSAMLIGTAVYTVASSAHVDVRYSIAMMSFVFLIIIWYMLQIVKKLKLIAPDSFDLN